MDTHAGAGTTVLPDYRIKIEGSPIRALNHGFDAYYLYEIDKDHWNSLCGAIEDRLGCDLTHSELVSGDEYAIRDSDPRILVFNMDSNDGVDWLIKHGNPNKHWFTFVDPEKIKNSVQWELLQKLISRGQTDILYNFQSSGVVRTGADGAEHAHGALENALSGDVPRGLSQDEYVKWFRKEKIEPLGYHTASRVMKTARSNWRYDLIFASGNKPAVESVMKSIMDNEKTLRRDVVNEIEEARKRAKDPQEPFDEHLIFSPHNSDNKSTQSGLRDF